MKTFLVYNLGETALQIDGCTLARSNQAQLITFGGKFLTIKGCDEHTTCQVSIPTRWLRRCSRRPKKVYLWQIDSIGVPLNIVVAKRCIYVLPRRNLGYFMADFGDDIDLNELLLPGTHQTLARFGWPFAQCQNPEEVLRKQLENGIRTLDIRLSVIDNEHLIAYHDIISQQTSFPSVLETIFNFLATHNSEALIVSIKQEDAGAIRFNQLLARDIDESKGGWGMWFLESRRIPKLGEVRGKCLMFSRFGGTRDGWPIEKGLGFHPDHWPDSKKGFKWWCGETVVRVQDWYRIPSFLSIPEKTELATSFLVNPDEEFPTFPMLNISFTSASSIPFALPPTIAKGMGWPGWFGFEGVNSRFAKWLLEILSSSRNRPVKKITGWVFMDYYDDPGDSCISLLMLEINYRQHGLCRDITSKQ